MPSKPYISVALQQPGLILRTVGVSQRLDVGGVRGAVCTKSNSGFELLEGDRLLSESWGAHRPTVGDGIAAADSPDRQGQAQSGVRINFGVEILAGHIRREI